MKDSRFIYNFTKSFMRPYKGAFVAIILLGFVATITRLVAPYVIGLFVDGLTVSASTEIIIIISIILAVTKMVERITVYFSKIVSNRASFVISFDIAKVVIETLHRVPIAKLGEDFKAKTVNNINNDSYFITQFVVNFLSIFPGMVLLFVFPMLYVFSIDRLFGIFVLLALPLYVVAYRALKNKLFTRTMDFENQMSTYFATLSLQLFNTKFIKLNNIGDKLIVKLSKAMDLMIFKLIKKVKIEYMFDSIGDLLQLCFQVILMAYGGILVVNGTMNIGAFVALTIYFPMVIGTIGYFMEIGKQIQENKVFVTRLTELKDTEQETNGNIKLDKILSITCSDLNFSYGDKHVFLNFNQRFETGKTYVLLGENGKGKSTLVSLILGLYNDNYIGSIKYNETEILDIDMRHTRGSLVGISAQEPILLADTIKYNMTFEDNENANTEKLNALIDDLGLSDYIDSTKDSLETVITEESSNLSGGQKQKISIIQAIYKDPQLLVLDEPTSALDDDSRARLLNCLHKTKSDRITIIITHDKEFMDIADEIIVLG